MVEAEVAKTFTKRNKHKETTVMYNDNLYVCTVAQRFQKRILVCPAGAISEILQEQGCFIRT